MNGIIIKINSDLYTVKLNNGSYINCKCRGKFRNLGLKPLVGDIAFVNIRDEVIERVEDRRNELLRPSVANIDKLIIVASTHIPKFSSYLLDKFIVIANKNNIEPVIVITKSDLLNKEDKKEIKKYVIYYKKLGIKVYLNTELRKIKTEFKNKIVALAGQTGAGKSTLLNCIDKKLSLKTGEVSKSLGRGKHTTRLAILLEINNGLVADTPGFSSLDLYEIKKEDIKLSYIDFPSNCKYKTCMHYKEEDCEVKKYIKKKKDKILDERYNNYIKLLKEVEA